MKKITYFLFLVLSFITVTNLFQIKKGDSFDFGSVPVVVTEALTPGSVVESTNKTFVETSEPEKITKEEAVQKLESEKLSREQTKKVFESARAEKVEVQGRLKRLLSTEGNIDVTRLETAEKNYSVYVLENDIKLEPGTEVRAKGYEIDGHLGLEAVEIMNPVRAVTGQQDLLIITFNWANDNSQPFTEAQIAAEIFGNSDSSKNYYTEASYANISLNGNSNNVTDAWYQIAHNKNVGCSLSYGGNLDQWTDAADALAEAAGYNLSNYDRIGYLFPDNSSCNWSGLGEVGGWRTWFNGTSNSFVYSHELGHNFGAGHSNSLDCGTSAIAAYDSCAATEYGDPFDVMGDGFPNQYHMNVAWKEEAGWFSGKTREANSSGTYTINYLEAASSGYQGLKINKPNTNDYYLFEFRKATGFDASLGAGVTRGLTGRIYSDYFNQNYYDTYLLDLTPNNGWTDIALSDGGNFYDAANNIRVTQVSHTTNSVTVRIDKPYDINQAVITNSLYFSSLSPTAGETLEAGFSV